MVGLVVVGLLAKVEAEYPGSFSTWEVLETELTATEGVIPLSTTVSYPHQRVRIQEWLRQMLIFA